MSVHFAITTHSDRTSQAKRCTHFLWSYKFAGMSIQVQTSGGCRGPQPLATFDSLPEELQQDIANRTDRQTRLLGLAYVSKSWRRLISEADEDDLQYACLRSRKAVPAFLSVGPTGQAVRSLLICSKRLREPFTSCKTFHISRRELPQRPFLHRGELGRVLARLPNLTSLAVHTPTPFHALARIPCLSALTALDLCLGRPLTCIDLKDVPAFRNLCESILDEGGRDAEEFSSELSGDESLGSEAEGQVRVLGGYFQALPSASLLQVLVLELEPFESAMSALAPELPKLKSLKQLALGAVKPIHEGLWHLNYDLPAQLQTVERLESLFLFGTCMRPDAHHKPLFRHLTRLEIYTWDWDGLTEVMEDHTCLKHFSLRLEQSDNLPDGVLTWLSQLTFLSVLVFGDNSEPLLGIEDLDVSEEPLILRCLQELSLCRCRSLGSNIAWDKCEELRSLSLNFSEVGDAYKWPFTELTYLSLSHQNSTFDYGPSEDGEEEAASGSEGSDFRIKHPITMFLKEMCIEDCFKEGEGIPEYLYEAGSVSKITFRECCGLQVTEVWANWLWGMIYRYPPSLQVLNICRCPWKAEAKNKAAEAETCAHLDELYKEVAGVRCPKCYPPFLFKATC